MFKPVTLYAVRGRWDGRDILEGSDVIVKTSDGRKISGRLEDVGYEHIDVFNYDESETYEISYGDIEDISD